MFHAIKATRAYPRPIWASGVGCDSRYGTTGHTSGCAADEIEVVLEPDGSIGTQARIRRPSATRIESSVSEVPDPEPKHEKPTITEFA